MRILFIILVSIILLILFSCYFKRDGIPEAKDINYPEDSPVKSITFIKENAGSPDWSPNGNEFIVYHAKGDDGYYDIHIMKENGSEDKFLTENHPLLPNKHIGEPIWHPSGEWILFKAEKEKHILEGFSNFAVPAIGFHNDIWIMSPDGKDVFQLTNLKTKMYIGDSTPTSGILNPHFSDDGKKISWSEKIEDVHDGDWGGWVIRVGDFVINENQPEIKNIKTYAPGANQKYFESNDFMPDGRLLICGNLEPKQSALGIDIYILNLENKNTLRLTDSLEVFDECPHISHDGRKIAYLSTEGYSPDKVNQPWWKWVRAEIWLMNSDGSEKKQITHFNRSGYPEYTGTRVVPGKIAWASSGKRLLLGVALEKRFNKLVDSLYIVELK